MARLKPEHRYTIGLLLLTASTGAIDAVSYISLDRVFTGNMTGNVLFLGFAIVGVAGIPFLNNAVALGGFIAGSIISGRIIGRHQKMGFPRSSAWILVAGAFIVVALGALWLSLATLDEPTLLVVTALLAAVMGAQVSAVRPIGNSDVSTIVVTNTVANLARDSRLGGGHGQRWIPRLLAVIAMGLGAAAGAAMIAVSGGPAAMITAAAIFTAGTATLIVTSRLP